jgi:hypothetical protein
MLSSFSKQAETNLIRSSIAQVAFQGIRPVSPIARKLSAMRPV